MTRRVGRVGSIVTVAFAVLLAVIGLVSFVRVMTVTTPTVGAEWVQSAAGPVVIAVETGSPASRAGLRIGDMLLAVDGREVVSALSASEIPWELEPGEEAVLDVLRDGRPLAVHLARVSSPRFEFFGYLALVGFAFLVSGAFIALRWPSVRGGLLYAVFAAAMFSRLAVTHTGAADLVDWGMYWLDLVGGLVASATLVHLVRVITRRRGRGAALAYLPAAGVLGLTLWLHPALLGGAYRFADPVVAVEFIDRAITLLFGGSVLWAAAGLATALSKSKSMLHRSQLRWMQWGLFIGFTPFLALDAIPWAVGATDLPSWAQFLGLLPMIVVPAAFGAALARYRLHDLDVLLRAVVREVSALFLTFAVYAAVVYVLRYGLDDLLELSRSATRYIGFLLAAVSYPQLRHWVKIGVDRAFYRKRYSYRATLQDWSRELAEEVELVPLLRRLRDRVIQTLGVPEAVVFVQSSDGRFENPLTPEPHGRLQVDAIAVERLGETAYLGVQAGEFAGMPWNGFLFGMEIKGRLTAILAVAERILPEEPLSTEDRSLLATLSAHAATAIEAARLLREVRQQADELRKLHARERTILESSAIGLLMLGPDGRILAWNRALEGIYALPRADAIGRTLGEVFPLHFVRYVERRIATDDPGGESRAFRYTLVNREGERRILNLAISPAAASGGGTGSARVVTFDDVSERVKLEEQVVQQERLASLGLLAAGVAHEVNTPLTGISSYTQMLQENPESAEARQAILQKIEAQTRRASEIANSLLNLAHPERTAFEDLSLNVIVRDTLQLFEPQVRRNGVRLEVDLDDALPAVRGHRGKLQQVLLNLLLNARDALDDDGMIRIRTFEADGRVALEVADDGAGVSEDDLPRIFDPFFTTKGRGQGTGLGLSICYGIVREHDGEIVVESEPGARTCFRIELPSTAVARAFG